MEDQTGHQNQAVPTQPQPAINTTPPPSVTVTPMTLPPKRSKKGLLIGLVVGLLVLLGGVGAAAFYIIQNNKPEKVLADALTNTVSDLVEEKPIVTAGVLSFESKGEVPAKLRIIFDSKTKNEDSQGSVDLTIELAGKSYNLKASAVMFGEKEYYFKVENLKRTVAELVQSQPGLAGYNQQLEPIINKIDNRWVKVTQQDLKEAGLPDEEKVDKCTTALQNLQLSKQDKKQLKKLFKENQFIIASETFKSETVAKESSFHYKLDFNNQAAESFAKQVIAMQSFENVKKDCGIEAHDIENGFKDIGKQSRKNQDITKPVIELWVGKKSRRPTKIRISAHNKQATLDFNTEVSLNAENISIDKPDSSIPVSELRAEIEKLLPART